MTIKAIFSDKTKRKIYERDWERCIFCPQPPMDFHHVFFWIQTNYSKDRNKETQWVTVCRDCHNEIHSCSTWQWKRQKAIDYLKIFYNQNKHDMSYM
jgi:hypothetical protein